jgi:hypothetical protein
MNSITKARFSRWLIALLAVLASVPATAQETLTNAYDARARLVAVGHCGAVNNGVSSAYSYDPADNRSNLTLSTTAGATVVVNPTSLPTGVVGSPYLQKVAGGGGSGGYTYTLLSGSLPAGVTLNVLNGVLSGTPTTAAAYTFTVKAADCLGNNGSRAFSVTIKSAALTLNPATLTTGTAGTAYSQTVTATGGAGGYSYAVASGSLPAGLSLNASTGAITGTPSTANAYAFTLQATDSSNNIGARAYTLTIGIGLMPATLPAGTVNVAYNQTIVSSGGSGGYNYSLSTGALPTGLGLGSSSGIIYGTPTTANNYAFTLRAADVLNNSATRAYNILINLALNPASLPDAVFGSAYSQIITAIGGSGTYSYSAGSGLPPGLTLSSAGALTGTPTSAGTYNFTVTGNDTSGHTGSQAYSIRSALKVSPATLPNGAAGTGYVQPITASGGTGSYAYGLGSGALPPGIAVIDTGTVSGTPTTAGTYTFAAAASDSAGNTGSQTYTITMNLGITPTTLPGGLTGTAYYQQFSATGGSHIYMFSAGPGVPPGLSLSSAGTFSGTPTSGGTYNFTVNVSDTAGNVGSLAYALNIGTPATCGGVSFSVANTSATAPYPLYFTVTATGSASIACTLNYATSDASGVAGVNYVAKSGTLSFPSSPGTQTVQVTTIAGGEYPLKANMHLNLSSPSSGATISTPYAIGSIASSGGGCKTCIVNTPPPSTTDTTSTDNPPEGPNE